MSARKVLSNRRTIILLQDREQRVDYADIVTLDTEVHQDQ